MKDDSKSMNNQMRAYAKEIKTNLENLINQGIFHEAKEIIKEYETIIPNDPEILSMKSVIFISEGNLSEAEKVLKTGLQIDPANIDMLYNLGFIYENKKQYPKAVNCYTVVSQTSDDPKVKRDANTRIEEIKQQMSKPSYTNRPKIAFFIKKGMNSFVEDIIEGLSQDFETKKIIVSDLNQIETFMRWADICWFEWCDELIIYASKLEIAKGKKIICRLHSYEAFTGYTHQVNWDNIDKVIFVAEHIRDFVIKSVKSLEKEQTVVIPNGIDTNKFKFKKREKGFNIAYVGYINYKKGPMLLLHTFKAIYDRDNRYKLYIAGQFQDYRYLLYFEQMIKEMGLENNVIFDGWQDDIDSWLDDKNYIISTSVLESQHLSTMEAMSKGIKPIIHNFVGAKDIYKDKYIWNTIDEAVEMIVSDEYDSEEYRQFIVDNYLLKTQTLIILKLLLEIRHNKYIDKSTVIKLGDIKEMVEEFIPYDFTYVNNYNTDGCNILIGKIEKVDSRFDYIECILKNKFAEQLIISGVWYDNINKKILLPSYLLKSEKLDYIDQLINEILHFEVKYSNNIGGFILDEEILEGFQKNKVAYMWERGIPATQFMPLSQYLKIIARYKFASKYISKNDLILEAASGFGYGAAYLSKKCNKVVALDIAEENIDFGRNTYKFNNIDWIKGDVLNLPYQNNTFDKYISFETLEHLPVEQVKLYLNEALRVLKPDSKFIISTPNEATRKNVHNPFHIKEYNFNEFKSLLEVFFKDIEYFSVKDYQIMEGISDNANNMLAVCSKF